MASTVVCHNFASETTAFKLNEPAEPPAGNWAFLQTVTKGCYGHPLSPYTALSAKSLELCTENLGSETGSDTVTDCSSIFSCSPPSRESPTASFWTGSRTLPRNPCDESRHKARDFPPPLTTMTGSNSLQVSRRTEGGRLIIEAVETPFRNSYLQAERSDGRLRLCFLTAEATCSTAGAEEEENEQDECGGETAEDRIEEDGSEFESEEEEGLEFDGEINLELEIENFQQPSGCKQGSDGLSCNWNPPLWVATS